MRLLVLPDDGIAPDNSSERPEPPLGRPWSCRGRRCAASNWGWRRMEPAAPA